MFYPFSSLKHAGRLDFEQFIPPFIENGMNFSIRKFENFKIHDSMIMVSFDLMSKDKFIPPVY